MQRKIAKAARPTDPGVLAPLPEKFAASAFALFSQA